ncbi:MAG: DUF58 domain-containing protein [Steroidobacteraceae bacterium]|nr:DUF58 domain-containing protein [Steroidobacteraceae bacterium]
MAVVPDTPSRARTAPVRPPGWRDRLNERAIGWARRRHGDDTGAVTITRRRVYILPTGLGVAYALMLFAMLLGGLNYGNNLALVLTFLLAGGAWVAMHECHRNLVGVTVAPAGTRAPFAGDPAEFGFRLTADRPRHDLLLRAGDYASPAAGIPADGDLATHVQVPTERRGRVKLARLRVESTFPLGLFTAWTWIHPELAAVVYPRPAPRGVEGPPPAAEAGAAQDGRARGEEDFDGLREFREGDPPRRIAWKAYARGGALVVKEYVGSARTPVTFDLDTVPGRDLEARLQRLARWIVDAEERGDRYGIRLGSVVVPAGSGLPHRNQCLARLATYRLGGPT